LTWLVCSRHWPVCVSLLDSADAEEESEETSPFPGLDRKKAHLDACRPLPPVLVSRLKEYFDVEWTHHSTAIEGNTLTLQETLVVLKHGITIGGKSLREHLEVVDHQKAIDFVESLARVRRPVTEEDLMGIHRLVLAGIEDTMAGQYRAGQVRIAGSRYLPPPPQEVPRRMKEFLAWLEYAEVPDLHPVFVAAKAHLELVTIHPFVDGNGRTARLLQNLLLMRRGFPPAVIRVEERAEYYQALEQVQMGEGEEVFILQVARAVDRSLDVYLEAVGTEASWQE
jgi:Fic family protein